MTTLIVPCAGKSSRFPGLRPKWLLTHPCGKLMIEMVLESIEFKKYDRVIVTIVAEHCLKYDADLILEQIFEKNIEICILPEFTKSASETIYQTIKKSKVSGDFIIKDCDNIVKFNPVIPTRNGIVGASLNNKKFKIDNPLAKSYLLINKQNIIEGIVEKKIVSDIVCLGVYCFESAEEFCKAYESLSRGASDVGECFVSHVVQYMLSKEDEPSEFFFIEANWYVDWGTLVEWKKLQKKNACYFVDFDGVLVKNYGKYGRRNWNNTIEPIEENIQLLARISEEGGQIIITTSRTSEYKETIEKLLTSHGVKVYTIVFGINHAPRVLVNDFAASNPYPSASAINIPRNGQLKDYINY